MIKLFIMDIDGTLTNGKIYIGEKGEMFKAFDVKDGYGISYLLKQADIEPIIITGRKSEIVVNRCKELGIKYIFQNSINKIDIINNLLKNYNGNDFAYIGDDIPDLPCIEKINKLGGITGCPRDAVQKVKSSVNFVSNKDGGNGCVREFIEWILKNRI